MKETYWEPGLLRLFRIYAAIRLVFLVFLSFSGNRFQLRMGILPSIDFSAALLIVGAEIIFLFIYLLWPWLERKLGRLYLPLALIFAIGGLIIEGQVLYPFANIFQPVPFQYILLILVAWQYNYRDVVLFTLGAALFEIGLIVFYPIPEFFLQLPPEFNRFITYGGLAARTISFLVLGYVVTSLMKAQRAQRRELRLANQKMVQHASTLEQLIISRERNRISRELHDTLAHTLSALAVQLDAVTAVWQDIPGKARELLDQMLGTTRTGLDETRRSLRALRAEPLEEMGLALAVRTLAEDFATRESMELDLDIPENLDDLSPEVEQCYYRIAQEALENIARHANAQRLSVRMQGNRQGLRMTVSDDGHGFDVASEIDAQTLGLLGMRERAELVGARLEVISRPDRGTTIQLIFENGT